MTKDAPTKPTPSPWEIDSKVVQSQKRNPPFCLKDRKTPTRKLQASWRSETSSRKGARGFALLSGWWCPVAAPQKARALRRG